MHIIVCIKSIVTKAPSGKVLRTAQNLALNPYDRPALEMALQLRESHGGSVTALSMGPRTAEASLRETLALGVNRAVLLCDPAFAGADTLATSTTLCAAVQRLRPFDLVLFGARTSDSDTGQVGPQTAVLLDLPAVTNVCKATISGNCLVAERELDGFQEVYEIDPPAAITVHPTAVIPREPSLGGIVRAFDEMPVERVNRTQLGLAPCETGDAGSPTRVLSMKPVQKERTCHWIEGTPAEQADALVRHFVDRGLVG